MKKVRRKKSIEINIAKSMKKNWKKVPVFILVFIAALFLFSQIKHKILYSSMFVIEEIRVKGNVIASSEEILGDAEVVYETPFFLLDNKKIEKNILHNNRIQRAIVTKKFPNVVEIFVEEKETIALVPLDITYELAKDGSLMKLKIRDCDFPIITGFNIKGNLSTIEKRQYEKELKNISKLLIELHDIDANLLSEFSEITINSNKEFVGYLRNGITSILFGKDELYTKGINLYSLLQSNKNEFNNFNEIDLRFNNLAYAR